MSNTYDTWKTQGNNNTCDNCGTVFYDSDGDCGKCAPCYRCEFVFFVDDIEAGVCHDCAAEIEEENTPCSICENGEPVEDFNGRLCCTECYKKLAIINK